MATEIEESRLKFRFDGGVVHFDDTEFYKSKCQKMAGKANRKGLVKGIDFISVTAERITMMEVKNCLSHEDENRWRLTPDNQSRKNAPPHLDVAEEDSYDIEVVKKATFSIAFLYGAWRWGNASPADGELRELGELWNAMNQSGPHGRKRLRVILFLEGNFGGVKKSRMDRLRESIQGKLSCLNCEAFVLDSETCGKYDTGFTVTPA